MPREEEQRILDGYAAWDPRQASSDELLESLQVTRATLYNVLHRNGVTPKTRERATAVAGVPPLSEGAMDALLKVAIEDMYQGRVAAERRVEELEEAIRRHPRCKNYAQLLAVLGDD